jgi:hypothetical protein
MRAMRAVLHQHGADLSCKMTPDGALTSMLRLPR